MFATMLVSGATVVATRRGRPSIDVPFSHLEVDGPALPSPPHPATRAARAAIITLTFAGTRPSMPTTSPPLVVAYGRLMKVDATVMTGLNDVAAAAQEREAAGYSGLWTAETAHDPFLPLVLAAEHTSEIDLGTSIAVAFARNPMLLANIGWDVQSYSKGRFILGLGSQVKPHITKRFSMEWSHPAPRMREMILAIRAIWDTWLNGTPLDFRGDFYTHTLMTPFFTPDAADLEGFGVPKIFLAGVGTLMTEVAGEVCDGFLCHGFTTERYLREVT